MPTLGAVTSIGAAVEAGREAEREREREQAAILAAREWIRTKRRPLFCNDHG